MRLAEGTRRPRNPFARLANRPHRSDTKALLSAPSARQRSDPDISMPIKKTRQGFGTTASPNGYDAILKTG